MKYPIAALVLVVAGISLSCSEKRYKDALSPEEALESFELNDQFRIEVFAAEPDVTNPVDLVFDERGNAYVVEMPDYPYKPEAGKGMGRIRKLVDTNGDGRIDQTTIFADSLSEATSVLPWNGGLLVTAAPDILYFKDTDGDARADTKEVLFTGFFQNNSEAQITNLRFGIDNWIYASNNGQDGNVTFRRKPGAPPLSMKGGDFRFRLDRDQYELETGQAQFGQTFNDWGHRFITQNTRYLQHAVIPWRYTHRHPYLPSTKGALQIGDPEGVMYQRTAPPYWRAERSRRRQEQFDEQKLDRKEHAEDHFTGASGGTIYAGDAFPGNFYGNIFIGDVAGNLVHRAVLTPSKSSPTYVASRAEGEKDREFLSSSDPWFRPVGFTVGPDGYLYVLDMYRQHIETPVSIPEDLKTDMNFENGKQHGRIYRIVPKQAGVKGKSLPAPATMEAAQLVGLLSHPNQWWRLQAQRLLLERQDASVIPSVKALFAGNKDPRVRLHALFVLEGLNALNAGLVKQALADAHPGVREYGLILAERYSDCLPQVLEKATDPSPRVAFQAALSLGEFPTKQVVPALVTITEKYGRDPWFRMALLSSEAGSSLDLLKQLVSQGQFFRQAEPEQREFLEDFSFIIGSRNRKGEATQWLDLLDAPALKNDKTSRSAALLGFARGLKKSKNDGLLDPRLKEAIRQVPTDSLATL